MIRLHFNAFLFRIVSLCVRLMGSTIAVPLATLGAGYMATSLYYLRRPRTREAPRMPRTRLIAHRGGAAEGYENTLAAFRRAVQAGAGMLELDVHLTRDGKVVVAHDQHLHRLTDLSTNIRDLEFSKLPRLKEKISIDFCPGETFCDTTVMEEERSFCLLSQVLHEFPHTQINIDIKVKDIGLVEAVNKIIVQNGAEERCVWGNFSPYTTEYCYQVNPNVGLLFSAFGVIKLYLLFYSGLIPFVDLKETHLEIPMPSVFLNDEYRASYGNVGMAKYSPWLISLMDAVLMSPLLFRHLSQRGVTVYLWTLNTEEQFERAFNLGANGVMTDRPTLLRNFLQKMEL